MKKTFSILILCLTLLLAGCGVSSQDVMDSIPALTLESGSNSTTLPSFGYEWTVTNQWATATALLLTQSILWSPRKPLPPFPSVPGQR